jgi:hypothetical protein
MEINKNFVHQVGNKPMLEKLGSFVSLNVLTALFIAVRKIEY